MESDCNPFLRALPRASDPDDLVTWCTDADHGRCKAYLAKVISVDDDDSEATDEEEEEKEAESLLQCPPLYITENVVRTARPFEAQTIVSIARSTHQGRLSEDVDCDKVFDGFADDGTTYYFDDAVISEGCFDSEAESEGNSELLLSHHYLCPADACAAGEDAPPTTEAYESPIPWVPAAESLQDSAEGDARSGDEIRGEVGCEGSGDTATPKTAAPVAGEAETLISEDFPAGKTPNEDISSGEVEVEDLISFFETDHDLGRPPSDWTGGSTSCDPWSCVGEENDYVGRGEFMINTFPLVFSCHPLCKEDKETSGGVVAALEPLEPDAPLQDLREANRGQDTAAKDVTSGGKDKENEGNGDCEDRKGRGGAEESDTESEKKERKVNEAIDENKIEKTDELEKKEQEERDHKDDREQKEITESEKDWTVKREEDRGRDEKEEEKSKAAPDDLSNETEELRYGVTRGVNDARGRDITQVDEAEEADEGRREAGEKGEEEEEEAAEEGEEERETDITTANTVDENNEAQEERVDSGGNVNSRNESGCLRMEGEAADMEGSMEEDERKDEGKDKESKSIIAKLSPDTNGSTRERSEVNCVILVEVGDESDTALDSAHDELVRRRHHHHRRHSAGDADEDVRVSYVDEEELLSRWALGDVLEKARVPGVSLSPVISCSECSEDFSCPPSVPFLAEGASLVSDVAGEGQGAEGRGAAPGRGTEDAATESLNELMTVYHLGYYAALGEHGCGKALSPEHECQGAGNYSTSPTHPQPRGRSSENGTVSGVCVCCLHSEEDCAEREALQDHKQEADSLLLCVEGEGSGDKLFSWQFHVNEEDDNVGQQEEVYLHQDHSGLSVSDDGRLLESWEAPDASSIVITCEVEEASPSELGEEQQETLPTFTDSEESLLPVTRQKFVDAHELTERLAPQDPVPPAGRVNIPSCAEASGIPGNGSDSESAAALPDVASSDDQPQTETSSEAIDCGEDGHTEAPDDTLCCQEHAIIPAQSRSEQELDASITGSEEKEPCPVESWLTSPSEDEALAQTEDTQTQAGSEEDVAESDTNFSLKFDVNLEGGLEEQAVCEDRKGRKEGLIEEEEERKKQTPEESELKGEREEEIAQEERKDAEEEKQSFHESDEEKELTQDKSEEEEEAKFADEESKDKDELTSKGSEKEELQEEEKERVEEEEPLESWSRSRVVESRFEPEEKDDAGDKKDESETDDLTVPGLLAAALSDEEKEEATEVESNPAEDTDSEILNSDKVEVDKSEEKENSDEVGCAEGEKVPSGDNEEGDEKLGKECGEKDDKEKGDEIPGKECVEGEDKGAQSDDLSDEIAKEQSDKGERDESGGDDLFPCGYGEGDAGDGGDGVSDEVRGSDEVTEEECVETEKGNTSGPAEALNEAVRGDAAGANAELGRDETNGGGEGGAVEVEGELHEEVLSRSVESAQRSDYVTQALNYVISEEQSVGATDGLNYTEEGGATLARDLGDAPDRVDENEPRIHVGERKREDLDVDAREITDKGRIKCIVDVTDKRVQNAEKISVDACVEVRTPLENERRDRVVAHVRFAIYDKREEEQGSEATPDIEGENSDMPAGDSLRAEEQLETMDAIKSLFGGSSKLEREEEEEEETAMVVERRKTGKGMHGTSSNRDSGTSYLTVYEDPEVEEEEQEAKKRRVQEEKKKEDEESDDDTLVGHSSRSVSSGSSSSNSSDGFRKCHRREDSGVFVSSSHRHRRAQSEAPVETPNEWDRREVQPRGTCAEPTGEHEDEVDAKRENPREQEDNLSIQSEGMEGRGEEEGEAGGRRFKRRRSHQFRVGRRYSGQKMMQRIRQGLHLGKKTPEGEANTEVHPTKLQDRERKESFGKRTGGLGRRTNECLILEPSEMLVIDYPDVQLMRPGQRASCNTMNLEKLMALEQDEITIRPGGRGAPPPPPGHHHQYGGENDHHHHAHHTHHDAYLPDLVGSAIQRGARSRGSVGSSVRDGSDTSSAYSGSDTMCHSLQSSLEPDDVDLSGLTESAVDSDEEDLAESIEILAVRDAVRECLEKDPSERSEDDIKVLLEFTQRLRAFANMTLAVRKAMCQAMVFAVVEEAGTVLMNHGEELDSWSVIINGHVEVTQPDGLVHELHLGDSFGITPTMEKLYHQGVMRSKVDDCQFVCIRQTDYYRILHQSEENIRRHEEDGVLVLVTEQRPIDAGNRKGDIVIKGTADRLMQHLVEVENNVDPTFVEDFLLTHRTFIESPLTVANKLLEWFEDPSLRDRVTRVVLLWVNNHFTDFEMDPQMMNFLEQFEEGLEREKMAGQLRLLDFACATKARARTVTLTRPSRDEILHFSILGGQERGFGIFISKVEKSSKAEEVGLKRGDQILEVNGQSFDRMNHAKALEILRQTCHLSITVKSNLLAFKEMLMTPENSPRPRSRKPSDVHGLTDPNNHLNLNSNFASMTISGDPSQQSPKDKGKMANNKGSSVTTKANKIRKKVLESLMQKNNAQDSQANSDDSVSSQSSISGGLYHSHSNPDLSTTGAFEDIRTEFPEHVLKVYRATDQAARFLPVHKETTAREVVMLSLQIFNISDPTGSSNYALYEVSVTEEGITKTKRLPDSMQNLAERIALNSRYYLRNITMSQTSIPDDIVNELVRESTVCFLQLNSVDLAIQLTLEDYTIFRQIELTEYIDDLFGLKSNYGTPALSRFSKLVNREMFWVVTEVCSEHNLVKRSKIIKQFIKVARQCKECKNFNSMFAILSGLGHGSVLRLKQTWERLPSKYQRMCKEMQDLMDPSRNMSKYRNLVQNENIQSPIIPFYPVVNKDLTFTHEGNDDKVEGLINFEKLRMISRYIRDLHNMCSAPYDLFNIQDPGGQPPSSALITLNQMAAGGHQIATVKRRKKSTAAPDKKKMYEEAQMVRRVKAYLAKLNITTDEDKLRAMSYECEGGSEGHKLVGTGSANNNNNSNNNNNNNNNHHHGGSNSAPPTNPPPRRRPHSPTPSTTSSTSSTSQTSDGKKQTAKFGATSPQSISKMKALAEPKTKPHHGPRSTSTHHSLSPSPSPGPPRRGSTSTNNSRSSHERSHSDTHAVPVDLSAESSSVTSLSKLHKSHTSGSMASTDCQVVPGGSDSGISAHFDGHSSSSLEVEVGGVPNYECYHHSSPPAHHRRYSHQPGMGSARLRRGGPGAPPDYIATQLRMKQMGRALSHDGVQYYHPTHHDDEEEDAQVSAV